MKKKIFTFLLSIFVFLFAIFSVSMPALACTSDSECLSGQYCDPNPDNSSYGTCVDNGQSNSGQIQETSDVNVDLSQYLTLRDGQKVSEVFSKPSDLINLLVRVVFVAAGLVIFIMIIIAGVSMIASDGKEMEKAKTTMTNAGIGFILLFAAYWIMQIIALVTGANIGF